MLPRKPSQAVPAKRFFVMSMKNATFYLELANAFIHRRRGHPRGSAARGLQKIEQ